MLHRDIKPENFMMGVGNYDQYVHLIDFGLSRKYRSGRTGRHILLKSNCSLTGTARYASVNAHQGIEQTRRDDMESLGFLLMYFIKGKLPWQGLKAGNRAEKYNRISEVKIGTTIDELCKGYPRKLYFL